MMLIKSMIKYVPALLLASGGLSATEPQNFRSGPEQVALLELFSSEGCSSCPPAEAWLSRLDKQDGLWTQFVPIAFHVDYWDGLGWKDPFAQPAFTSRQRSYASLWRKASVYTPDVVWNGEDWNNWAQAATLPKETGRSPGILEATREAAGDIRVHFYPTETFAGGTARAALLGSGLLSDVKRGENSGVNCPRILWRWITPP